MKNIWVSVSGAIAQQGQVDTIANNVANANTPGFKRDGITFKEYLTALEKGGPLDTDLPHKDWKPEDFYRSYGAEHAHVKVDGTYTDFEQGQLTPTGSFLDLALHGNGFLEVLTENGIRYTRSGTLSISKDGVLTTENGSPVLGSFGDIASFQNDKGEISANKLPTPQERILNVGNNKITINLEGEVFVKDNKVGELSLVEFKDPHALKKEGNSSFINPDTQNIKTTEMKTNVHQGFLEMSNVNAVREMSNLIKAHRQFESIQRVIKTFDQVTGKSVNEIARF